MTAELFSLFYVVGYIGWNSVVAQQQWAAQPARRAQKDE